MSANYPSCRSAPHAIGVCFSPYEISFHSTQSLELLGFKNGLRGIRANVTDKRVSKIVTLYQELLREFPTNTTT